jgi:hypothetical protein
MGNSNDTKRDATGPAQAKDREDRLSEATSDKTLSDIEEIEEDPSLENPSDDIGPSPDGLLDEPDEIKDAGPM